MMMASKYRIQQTLMQGLPSYVSVLLDIFVFVCVQVMAPYRVSSGLQYRLLLPADVLTDESSTINH